jgi:hypothetical protein
MMAVTVTYEVHIPTDIVMRLGHFSDDFIYKIHFREIIIMYQYKDFHFSCCQPHVNIQELDHECVSVVTRHFVRVVKVNPARRSHRMESHLRRNR